MVFIVAEVGINHNGSIEIAEELIEQAALAGCDAIKFQNYKTEDFLTDKDLTYTYLSQGVEVIESQFDMFKRYEIDYQFLSRAKEVCDKHSIEFLSTPTSEIGVDDLVRLGCKKIKNGSDFLSNLSLIKYMRSTGLEVIISTGMAGEREIDQAMNVFSTDDKVTLLHCTSSYPTDDNNVNLKRMISLRDKYKVPVGFSDHTIGSFSAVASTILGATFIEKHYTLDHNLKGPDHHFSITPKELNEYVKAIRRVSVILGSALIEPSKSELKTSNDALLSIVYARDMSSVILNEDDLTFSRPGDGISPTRLNEFLGKYLIKTVKKGEQLKEDDFQQL